MHLTPYDIPYIVSEPNEVQKAMSQLPDILDFSELTPSAIQDLLTRYQINLTPDEALMIQHRFLNRPPTFAECVLWSIQGSEHCSYKSSRKHLKQFVTDGPHVILGPREDAGVVSVATDDQGRRYGVVMSHESHNHPSQIVPYEGAATGVGGNVRDVCCMGAEVIAAANSLRFGDITRPKTHFIHQGVVSGIAGYANPLGVPMLAGDVYYNPAYNDNCLVTIVTLGVVREDHLIHSYAPPEAKEDVFILVGKPTDNSGFGGASFASSSLQENAEESNKGAVQEPNAFLQRHLLKANYALFDYLKANNLHHQVGFKDLGAGGIACASVELAEAGGYGAEIDLEYVPVSQPDLHPAITLCSETQERFMWVVPPALAPIILAHYNETFALPQMTKGACAAVIGKIRTDGLFVVRHHNKEWVKAKASDVTHGILYDRPYVSRTSPHQEPELPPIDNYNQILLSLLKHENIASRAPLFEQFDKQVQGRTVIEAGWADAGLMAPFNEDKYPNEIRQTGIALAVDHNPRYNQIDAYWGAVNAVVECVRNIVAVGATPLAITDCLCFGNPEKEQQMGELVDAIRGIADACAAVTINENLSATLPVIAGNVSLYNESTHGSIPPSPMISCLGNIKEISKAQTFDLKQTNSKLFLVGERKDECGGSVYYQLFDQLGSSLPKPDLSQLAKQLHGVLGAIEERLVLAVHDISDGGLAVALAEMTFKRGIGIRVEIPGELALDKKLFSETGGFVLEVARDKTNEIKKHFLERQVPLFELGETTIFPRLHINGVIDMPIEEAKAAWENGLRARLL